MRVAYSVVRLFVGCSLIWSRTTLFAENAEGESGVAEIDAEDENLSEIDSEIDGEITGARATSGNSDERVDQEVSDDTAGIGEQKSPSTLAVNDRSDGDALQISIADELRPFQISGEYQTVLHQVQHASIFECPSTSRTGVTRWRRKDKQPLSKRVDTTPDGQLRIIGASLSDGGLYSCAIGRGLKTRDLYVAVNFIGRIAFYVEITLTSKAMCGDAAIEHMQKLVSDASCVSVDNLRECLFGNADLSCQPDTGDRWMIVKGGIRAHSKSSTVGCESLHQSCLRQKQYDYLQKLYQDVLSAIEASSEYDAKVQKQQINEGMSCPIGRGIIADMFCTPCPPGSFSPDERASCSACPQGTYQSQFGRQKCSFCPSHRTTPGLGARSIYSCSIYTQGSIELDVQAAMLFERVKPTQSTQHWVERKVYPALVIMAIIAVIVAITAIFILKKPEEGEQGENDEERNDDQSGVAGSSEPDRGFQKRDYMDDQFEDEMDREKDYLLDDFDGNKPANNFDNFDTSGSASNSPNNNVTGS